MIAIDSISLSGDRQTQSIIEELCRAAEKVGWQVADVDDGRPWGGFVRFEAVVAPGFIAQFFDDVAEDSIQQAELPLSPKFLVVKPHQRLSWQRHQRRSELWRFLSNGGAYSKSLDPDKQPVFNEKKGGLAVIGRTECHRLLSVGDNFVLVAEIWQHVDEQNLSDEDDIERLQDDYARA